jgi:hypothetical protein
MTRPKAHIKRQATQHNSLPSLLGVDNTQSEKVFVEEKYILYLADLELQRED